MQLAVIGYLNLIGVKGITWRGRISRLGLQASILYIVRKDFNEGGQGRRSSIVESRIYPWSLSGYRSVAYVEERCLSGVHSYKDKDEISWEEGS